MEPPTLILYIFIFCHMFMTTYSTRTTNAELVKYLRESQFIRTRTIELVMLKVDRGNYVSHNPYFDMPQSIGYGVTISAPHIHATALESLRHHLKHGERALDVGSGSGYLTVCMALMVGKTGRAVGIEHVPELVKYAKNNVVKEHPRLLITGQLKFIVGDGRFGSPSDGPFNAIHVGAAAPDIPEALIDQLKEGGRMVIPIGEGKAQMLYEVDKHNNGSVTKRSLTGVYYVPLTSRENVS